METNLKNTLLQAQLKMVTQTLKMKCKVFEKNGDVVVHARPFSLLKAYNIQLKKYFQVGAISGDYFPVSIAITSEIDVLKKATGAQVENEGLILLTKALIGQVSELSEKVEKLKSEFNGSDGSDTSSDSASGFVVPDTSSATEE